ncbi:hypothetical protein [Burkholderia sp. BDU5]|uniref:hypothetical protein n=1 Tax=Burkholderia sp. BDU5 TaxID=1385590 RepID=UPI0012E3CD15|nr:hypothetical protein [Burkholderia sp. BDU5]
MITLVMSRSVVDAMRGVKRAAIRENAGVVVPTHRARRRFGAVREIASHACGEAPAAHRAGMNALKSSLDQKKPFVS